MSQARSYKLSYNTCIMQKVFCVKEKKELVQAEFIVPRHPEFVYVKKVTPFSWRAKDMVSGERVTVKRQVKGDFYIYSIA